MVGRSLALLAVLFVLGHGASACVGGGDDDLNPQPLPPNEPDQKGGDTATGGGSNGGSSSSGSSSGGYEGTPAADSDAGGSDAGSDGDAGGDT